MDKFGETCFGCVSFPKGCNKLSCCSLPKESQQIRSEITKRKRSEIDRRST